MTILFSAARGLSGWSKLNINAGLLKLNKEIWGVVPHQPLPASGYLFFLPQGSKVARESLLVLGAKRRTHPGSEIDSVQVDDPAGQKPSFFGCRSQAGIHEKKLLWAE